MCIHNKRYTLLVIVSSLPELDVIKHMLREENFNIIAACDEEEAIRKSKEITPNMILLDIEVSARREFSAIQLLKRKSITKSIPVLFLTTTANEAVISECLNYNNTDFVSKPFRRKELVIRIKHQLSLFEAQRTIRKQEEHLKRTIESRDRLYSVIAHDLRSPIGTIKMINATIEEEKDKINDVKIRRLFEMINGTTEQAFNLLENLLRWSRNQNGKTKVMATNFDLLISARQVISLFEAIAKAKNITLNNHILEKANLHADEDMFKTVLRNLISNAIKFTYPGGQVDIEATNREEQIIISVKDNGQGIPEELQHKLLLDHEHVTSCGTKNENGSGLGLVLCRDFVKLNKGKLWFTSKEGKGTVFYFSTPQGSLTEAIPYIASP